jgi:hypothetical protein
MQTVARTLLLVAGVLGGAPAAAANGTLQFWEDSNGAPGVTAQFPTGVAQTAHIVFDASSAEAGGLTFGASEIEIRAYGSMEFVAFDCELAGCSASNYIFDPGTQSTLPRPGRVAVSDPGAGSKTGLHPVGTITFNAAQEPGAMPLVGCNYTDLELRERTCNQFVLVTLPEPAGPAALLCAAALLFGPLRSRRAR